MTIDEVPDEKDTLNEEELSCLSIDSDDSSNSADLQSLSIIVLEQHQAALIRLVALDLLRSESSNSIEIEKLYD